MSERNVLVVSMRSHSRTPAYTAWYEFEDLIREWEDAEILELPYGFKDRSFILRRSAYQLLRSIGISEGRSLRSTDWGSSINAGKSEFDLIVLTVSGFFDLFAVNQLRSSLSPTGKLVGLVIEAWPGEVDQRATSLEPVNQFDHLFIATSPGAAAFGSHLGRPVEYLSPAGDVLTRQAGLKEGRRSVGVVNPGRRSDHQHKTLLRACSEAERLYIYDTIAGGEVRDSQTHRTSYNTLLRNSELLVSNYAKFDQISVIEEERVIPGRLFEGIAAGNVLMGELPSDETLHRSGLAGVRSVEMSLKGAGPNVAEILADQSFLDEAKRTNWMLAASGHDWVHRWLRVLEGIGLSPTARAKTRLTELDSIGAKDDQRRSPASSIDHSALGDAGATEAMGRPQRRCSPSGADNKA